MLPAGEAIDEILKFKILLKKGDIIIDGGNSNLKILKEELHF